MMKRAPATRKHNPNITAAQRHDSMEPGRCAIRSTPPDQPVREICVITICRAVSRMTSLELNSGLEDINHLGFPSRQIYPEVQPNGMIDDKPANRQSYSSEDRGQERFAMLLAHQVHAGIDLSPKSRAAFCGGAQIRLKSMLGSWNSLQPQCSG